MPSNSPLYASIGSFIIDEIVYSDGRKEKDVLGGGGIFAIYGMRLWQPDTESSNVGYVLHKGFDYPKAIDDQISRLKISLLSKNHLDKHTTRGLNTFGENDHRDFEYIHPIIRTHTSDFPDDWIKSIKILHLISSDERAIEIIDQWRQREQELGSTEKTQFLWEPLPWACLPKNLDGIYEAAKRVDIVTPNHEELAAMLGMTFEQVLSMHNNNTKLSAEYIGKKFMEGVHNKTTLVVRCSKYGAMTMDSHQQDTAYWTPAFWDWKKDQKHVVDVTGAGNTFCGGYCYGWVHTGGDLQKSALYGAVSASYTVEQVGVPVLQDNGSWNSGPSPIERLEILETRTCVFE